MDLPCWSPGPGQIISMLSVSRHLFESVDIVGLGFVGLLLAEQGRDATLSTSCVPAVVVDGVGMAGSGS